MSYGEALLLGLVQGLTEFIPVSSSGHLVIFHEWLGPSVQDLAFDAVLQLATALAVFIYFRRDVIRLAKVFIRLVFGNEMNLPDRNLLGALLLGSIPAIFFGFLLEDAMATTFRSVSLVALALLAGSILMFIADRLQRPKQEVTVRSGFVIGLFQALALIPGFSRSGATIAGGLFHGFSREDATRFSFLLSLPLITGSGIKKLLELSTTGNLLSPALVVAFITSFVSGFFAIHYLLRYLRNHSLSLFIWYRVILAVVILLFL
jgi:undecaprenyl-diphosphatase